MNDVIQDWVDMTHQEGVVFRNERLRPAVDALRRRASTWDIRPMPPQWGRYRRPVKQLEKRKRVIRYA